MTIPFSTCQNIFINNQTNLDLYSYNGEVYMAEPGHYITTKGCNTLCGAAPHFYAWGKVTDTITLWIIPISGLLLAMKELYFQSLSYSVVKPGRAPFEPNQFWQTMVALVRWLGSPVISLSAILWNINLTEKCCMILDLATRYDELPPEGSQFADLRNSMIILTMMNQYLISGDIKSSEGAQAERLLRIALFSNLSLPNPAIPGAMTTTVALRARLAHAIQIRRRRGVVPNLLAYLWFIFAIIISIQGSFHHVGDNAVAHDLALGLVLSWIPILILCSIVDRNPVSAGSIHKKINKYVGIIRVAMLDPANRIEVSKASGSSPKLYIWTDQATGEPLFTKDFFGEFAGQARTRWHYGAAHSVVAGIENHVGKYGRGWILHPDASRALLCESNLAGIFWFNPWGLWEILLAMLILLGTAAGAFWISFWSPTVGLSCHSGGYMIFVILAFSLFFGEMISWQLMHRDSVARRWANAVLIFGETLSMCWLFYITIAQTIGLYETCECLSADWSPLGGYVNLAAAFHTEQPTVLPYWIGGTAFSCIVLIFGTLYVVFKWCEQSHLTTLDYGKAAAGLRRTRQFMRATRYLRLRPMRLVTLWLRLKEKITRKERRLHIMTWSKSRGKMNSGKNVATGKVVEELSEQYPAAMKKENKCATPVNEMFGS